MTGEIERSARCENCGHGMKLSHPEPDEWFFHCFACSNSGPSHFTRAAALRAHLEPKTDRTISQDAPTVSKEAGEMVEFLRSHHLYCTAQDGRFEQAADLITRLSATDTEAMRLLADIRACRVAARRVEGIHGSVDLGEGWNIGRLTALLPRIDALAKGGA